uniref:ARID domain-containing protein n=1 Tax=Anopheles maculatus TaxID=74869 RepID=A0A182T663_9DIPT
ENIVSKVAVLSFSRYCRYRALLKRLEGVQHAWLRNALVETLGGFVAPVPDMRIMFCKETFDYPELETHELLCNHLAPKLKGRPRGKRKKTLSDSSQYTKKEGCSDESESNESDVSDYSYSKVSPGKKVIDLHPTPRYNPRPSRGSSQTKQEPISVVISASAGTVKPSTGNNNNNNHLSQRNRSKSTSKTKTSKKSKSSATKAGRKVGRPGGSGKKSSSSSSNSSLAAAGGGGESEEDEEEVDEDGEDGGSSSARGASKDRDREDDADEDEEEMDYEEDEEEEDDNLFRVNERMNSAEREFLQRLQEFLDPRALQYADSQASSLKNVSLYAVYAKVQKIGGYSAVTDKEVWNQLLQGTGADNGILSRRKYEKII